MHALKTTTANPFLFFRYERQSIASKDRRGVGKTGRRPDIMFEVHREGKVYELLYGECSRIFCTPQKELDDKVKLWREGNEGLYWARKGCKREKEKFGIVGIQVAGYKIYICPLVPYKLIFLTIQNFHRT